MPLTPRMADSTEPWRIPELFRVKPNGVAAYIDGKYVWPASILNTFPRTIEITVTGDPAMARYARCIDVERFDATPSDVPNYIDAREAAGYTNSMVYCDRSTVAAVVEALGGREQPLWWIATLDNFAWTPGALADDIRRNFGANVAPQHIKAIQCYPGTGIDVSLCYGLEFTQRKAA